MSCNEWKETEIGLIPIDWEVKMIGEIGKVIGGGTPNTKESKYWDGDISWITPKDLSGYNERYIYKGERSITKEGLENSSARLLPKGTVLFSSRAPIGYVAIAGKDLTTNQGFKSIICNDEMTCNMFVYYLMKYKKEEIEQIANGSTFKEVSGKVLSEFKIALPPLNEQKAIAKILSDLDEKIEINNRINKVLEEIAQAIFKHWFVDFEFPNENGEPYKSSGGEFVDSELGPIPKGWKVIKISEICEIQIGGNWGKDDKFEGAVPVYCLRGIDLEKLKENGYSNELPLRWVKKSSLKKRMLSSDDILIAGSGVGPVGRTLYFHENIASLYECPLVYSNFCKRIKAKSEKYAIYIEQVLENMYTKGEMTLYINGTSVPNLNINGLIEHKVVLPTDDILNKYADFKSKVLARKYSKENLTLSQLCDTLLPKLMSGEIRVDLDNGQIVSKDNED